MKILSTIKNNIYELFIITALSAIECYYVYRTVFNEANSLGFSFLAVVFVVLVAVVIFTLPKKISIAVFAAIVIGIGYVIYYFFEPIAEFIVIVLSEIPFGRNIHAEQPMIELFVLATLFCLINYIFVAVIKRGIIAALISIGISYELYHLYDYINLWILLFILTVILILFIRWITPQKQYSNKEDKERFLIPFVLVFIVAAITAPVTILLSDAKTAPLAWIDELEWFENTEPQQSHQVIIRIDGQSRLTNLLDEYRYSDSAMMYVNSPYLTKLRNKTYDLYSKDGWEKEFDDKDQDKNTQYTYDEMIKILRNNNIPFSEYDMEVQMIAQSQMIFAPLNARIKSSFYGDINENPYDDLFVDEPLKEGSVYSLKSIKIDYKSVGFLTLITNSKSDDLKDMDNYTEISPYMKRTLQPLAENLTNDAESNYVKAKIIESYLSSQFEYTLEPVPKPENKDFVEYFLFESKQGFCTHYASSMVMLLRSIDIPCRYVTGYVLDAPISDEDTPKERVFTPGNPYDFAVQKNHSHAWVEVWFDDFGWLAFEPTHRYTTYQNLDYPENDNFSDMDFDNVSAEEVRMIKPLDKSFYIILGVILALLTIITTLIRVYISARRSNKGKIAAYWRRMQRPYYRKIKGKRLNETAREFYNRVDEKSDKFEKALELYEMAAFSRHEISDKHVEMMKELYKGMNVTEENESE